MIGYTAAEQAIRDRLGLAAATGADDPDILHPCGTDAADTTQEAVA